MKKYSDFEFLALPKWKKTLYKLKLFLAAIPLAILHFFASIGAGIVKCAVGVGRFFQDLVQTFVRGDWKTRVSYLIMGFGNITRGQILRGLLFFGFQVIFILYMISDGAYWISMLPSLGKVGPTQIYDEILDTYITQYGDNSFKILLYGVLSLFFVVAFAYTWYLNIRQNKTAEQILRSGKRLRSGKQDLLSMVDDNFHKTLMALPMTGIVVFTVMPIVFMILVAFTNYDGSHNGYSNNLFTWVGVKNFAALLGLGSGENYLNAFKDILIWTLVWAFLATFTNYFLGIFVAMAINKKGIKLKKLWRTILISTIAIPQFISLLYVSKMFAKDGLVNLTLLETGMIKSIADVLPFWTDATWARIMVIIINIWIGIPYLMLVATGILMNIPQDLYESAKIDGAGAWKQFTKITMPYMLFITGPYLLTQFIGNMNNFNVIYLLNGGGPTNAELSGTTVVGHTDLLVTWLFNMTTGSGTKYYMASVIGIMIFVVVALISLVVYRMLPSVKNEEDFQ